VEYLPEDYLFRDSRLSRLAEMFRRKDFPGPEVLLEAWRDIV